EGYEGRSSGSGPHLCHNGRHNRAPRLRSASPSFELMSTDQKDTYFVAVKVFLEKDGNFLVFKDNFNDWDLPGGRIRKEEFEAPLEEVVLRKMSQELGNGI